MQRDAQDHTPCGCGECSEKLNVELRLGKLTNSDLIVHFVVPSKRFWDDIGYT